MNAFELNMKEFRAAAAQCIEKSERTYPVFINSRLLHVAKKAIEDTEKANADKIVNELAANVRKTISVSRKTGKQRTSRRYDVLETSLAARIINARLKARGEPLLFGTEMAKAARRMIAARLRAVAFIRSGWVYAVRTLGAAVGGGSFAPGAARMKGAPKGYAVPARRAVSSVVSGEIVNTALLSEAARSSVARVGLAKAIARETREMMGHLAKKLQPVLTAHSAK